MTKKHLGFVLGVVAALAAAAWLIFRPRQTGFEFDRFTAAISGIDWRWMSLALALALCTYVGRAIRWGIMLRPLCQKTTFWGLFSATAIGFTAVVLFGRAGEPVRPYLIAKRANVSFSTQVAAWFVERIADLLMVLVLFGLALSQVSQSSAEPGPHIRMILETGGYAAGITGVIAGLLLIALQRYQGRVHERLSESLSFLPNRMKSKVLEFSASFDRGMEATRDRRAATWIGIYTALEWLVIAGSFWAVLKAFPVTRTFRLTDVIILLGFVVFGNVVQLPGIGGGMQISAVLVLTEFFGISVEAASGIALILWLITFVSIVPLGSVLAFHEGIKWSNLRHLSLKSETKA